MPFFELLSFLLRYILTRERKLVCQCPSSGFSHFYRKAESLDAAHWLRVNALLRASLISTLDREEWKAGYKLVSMPFFGLLSFLRCWVYVPYLSHCWYQCPSSGFSHFYHSSSNQQLCRKYVSMPFFGLLSFLLNNVFKKQEDRRYQCPSSGFSHFYSTKIIKANISKCVSMPFFGLLSFLRF